MCALLTFERRTRSQEDGTKVRDGCLLGDPGEHSYEVDWHCRWCGSHMDHQTIA